MQKKINPSDIDPFLLFAEWMQDAEKAEPNNPSAMSLATVSAQGKPSNRIVILKEHGKDGFTFFANSQSQKGLELQSNPHVAMCLYWKTLQRQIRIVGTAAKTSRETTETYFYQRARASQIASYASHQSQPLADKQIYLNHIRGLNAQYGEDGQIPCPDHCDGYKVTPSSIEFWQEGEARTHDRFLFTFNKDGEWDVQRLYP